MKRAAIRPAAQAAVAIALCFLPGQSVAQTVSGTVVDPTTAAPASDALVSVLDVAAEPRRTTLTDSLGRFVLEVEAGQQFYLEVSRLGYLTTRSTLLEIGEESSPPLTIELEPEPVALRGLEVEVEREAEEFLGLFGHTPESLGERWISREEIMAMPLSSGPYGVLVGRGIPGVRLESTCSPLGACPRRLCIMAREGAGRGGCALVLLNGVQIDLGQGQQITPSDLEAIAVLGAVDATTFLGTAGGNGAVLMWTRRGG